MTQELVAKGAERIAARYLVDRARELGEPVDESLRLIAESVPRVNRETGKVEYIVMVPDPEAEPSLP